jgi:hypothetical protein
MKPVVHRAKNFNDAERWEILQQINMTPEQRQLISKELKKKILIKNALKIKAIRKHK